ncbi:hypothetical protein D3C81_984540 [compost metagenome]
MFHAEFADQLGPPGKVRRGGQCLERYRHIVAVGQVLGTIGVGQPFGLGDQVNG